MKVFILTGLFFVFLLGCSKNENIVIQPEPKLSARYNLTFNATWSAQTHPTEFPASAHFSGLIGMTHQRKCNAFFQR